jgi:hypothetical protein
MCTQTEEAVVKVKMVLGVRSGSNVSANSDFSLSVFEGCEHWASAFLSLVHRA